MVDQVQVMHAAFAKAKDDVHDAAERLRRDRDSDRLPCARVPERRLVW